MKFLEIEETDTYNILYLFGIKIKCKKKSLLTKDEFELFLKKYSYILRRKIYFSNSENNKSNYIWQLWLQGFENAPEIVKKCTESVKWFCNDKDIIYLDSNNISKYIDIPDFIKEKYDKGIISPAHYSDYIRLELLSKYGGLWLDSTILLTDKIPDKIFSSDLFIFKDLGWFNTYEMCQNIPLLLLLLLLLLRFLKPDLRKPDISNWFIYSKPNNPLMLCTLQFLKDYWKKENNLKNYFMFHYWVRYAVMNDKKLYKIFEQIYNIPNLFPHLIQATWNDKFHENLFREICSLSPIHKLTYKNLDKCNKEYLDYILNLDYQKLNNSFKKTNWGFND